MKVTTSEIEGSQVVLEMEIEPERVEKAMDRAYRRIVSRVNIPGFRRGKAPRILVERVVGRESLMNEALEILVPEAYEEAVRETGIHPVDTPKLDVVSAEPLSVKATVPVRPKVELGDYRAIRQAPEPPAEVTEEQVERAVDSLRESRAQWVPVEREAHAGDLFTMDMRGRVEVGDQTFIDRQGLQAVLDPAQPILAPGVVEQLTGMKAGDRKAFDVTLPEDFQDKELAGQPAAIEVAAVAVKEKQLPDLDDEFARSLGDFASFEDMRAAVRKDLEVQAQTQARQNHEDSILAAVVDQATAEPRLAWVQEQAESLINSTKESVKRRGLTLDQFLRMGDRSEESFKEEMEAAARRQLKRTLVLGTVADAEGIHVHDEEVDAALARTTPGRKMDAGEREKLREKLRLQLQERKTINRLVEIASGRGAAEGAGEAGATALESETGEQE